MGHPSDENFPFSWDPIWHNKIEYIDRVLNDVSRMKNGSVYDHRLENFAHTKVNPYLIRSKLTE